MWAWRGRSKMSIVAPCSISRPDLSSATRSAISATTPMSCVMSRIAAPNSLLSSLMSFRICAWTVTSRAVVGSSAISTLGRQESAIAIITRCRMPPESSCGYCRKRRAGSLICTASSMSRARVSAPSAPAAAWVRMASVSCAPIVMTGFSEVIGS